MDLSAFFIEYLNTYSLPFIRVSGLLMIMPLIGTQLIGAQVRLILAMLITIAIASNIQIPPAVNPGTIQWAVIAVKELVIGVAHGFAIQMLFQTLVIGGQTIAMQAGLGFAQLVDPVNGVSVAAISQLYLLMANIFFFSTNGHLAVFQVLDESFRIMPIGFDNWSGLGTMNHSIFALMTWMFASGLLVALPVVISLLMVNLTFGVISKLSPQFNVFSFGFAFTVAVGILVVAITLPRILPTFDGLTSEALIYMRGLYG